MASIYFQRRGNTYYYGRVYGTNDSSKYPYGRFGYLGGMAGLEDMYFETDINLP